MKVFGADTRQAVRETRTTDYESESELGEGAEETPIHTTERNITKKLGGHFALQKGQRHRPLTRLSYSRAHEVISKGRDHLR